MFLLDDREGHEKIVNLDNLICIEIAELNHPDDCSVVCIMTDGRGLSIGRDSKFACVEIIGSIFEALNSQQNALIMSDIDV